MLLGHISYSTVLVPLDDDDDHDHGQIDGEEFCCRPADIYFCYRPADIYGGNGASWEAVPVSEKPLVEKLEKLNSV